MTSRQSAYDARRKAAGWRRVPVWLSPDLKAALDAHRASEGLSEQEAIVRAVGTAVGR